MARKFTRRLVVDASAAFRAGERTADANRIRDFLVETRRICHRVVMSPAILGEWDQHASPFARGWLTLMRSLGKEALAPLDTAESRSLGSAFAAMSLPDKARERMAKDLPLVDAALNTDGLMVSCDDEARGLFQAATPQIKGLRRIVWVNPAAESEDALGWLRAGARADRKRRLWRASATR
ncbi:MAG: hypothetical protein FJ290_04305 [Planctomycetes bacterium]|nr:hypothetical protein [Planctomycetota bacterium]